GAAADSGLAVGGEFSGGCADSGFTAGVGTPTICSVGPVGGKAHSPEEVLEIARMVPRAQACARAILALERAGIRPSGATLDGVRAEAPGPRASSRAGRKLGQSAASAMRLRARTLPT